MSPTKKKSSKKATAKKTASKKTAAKKSTTRKSTGKKTTTRKITSKKATSKKPAVKKAAAKGAVAAKPSIDHDEVSRVTARSLETISADIDRQMKMLAEIDTRVLIAKDQLADFQEMIQAKIGAFQERNAGKSSTTRKDLMASIRETRDEATKIIKESKAINDTYDAAVKYFEKGRVAALKEAKKAEAALVKNLHKIEETVVKKAGEIKKNIKR